MRWAASPNGGSRDQSVVPSEIDTLTLLGETAAGLTDCPRGVVFASLLRAEWTVNPRHRSTLDRPFMMCVDR